MKSGLFVGLLGCLLCLTACGAARREPPAAAVSEEWRGVWLSFLDLEPMLREADVATAQSRIEAAMDTCANAGINTVFFHVRAHSDAFYPSAVYPPAEAAAALLEQGFDPLACAVQAAHDRGLALHAWINPYRIGDDAARAAPDVGAFEQDGTYYYDPGDPAARRLVLDGVREILRQYAVDGVHFDDYFYPAGLNAVGGSFEDIPAGCDAGDWRRTQVDSLVSAVYGLAHQYGRIFGVSPIALPDKCRDSAYADVETWMTRPGYIDYICPQIYFGFANSRHGFSQTLAQWVAMPRRDSVRLYVGLALYKAGLAEDVYAGDGRREWAENQDIVARQVTALRQSDRVSGFVLFRYAQLAAPDGAAAEERNNLLPLMQDP